MRGHEYFEPNVQMNQSIMNIAFWGNNLSNAVCVCFTLCYRGPVLLSICTLSTSIPLTV